MQNKNAASVLLLQS